jgi:3-phosphoshikimate 1-carboxyvinyltransferase
MTMRLPPPVGAATAGLDASAAELSNHSRRFIMIQSLYHRFDISNAKIVDYMVQTVSPAHSVSGAISVPGDKSISHRFAMLTSIADGESRILNYSTGEDCQSTLRCMSRLGIKHEFDEHDGRKELIVHGKGIHGLQAPQEALDAGNSGSTIRMLSGILAAQSFTTKLLGDESLSKRPMRRIMTPLTKMGAHIEATNEQFPPLTIEGQKLKGIRYESPVASAQVKSCVLLAGLYAEGETTVQEPSRTRDHTEIALRELGADIYVERRSVRIRGGAPLQAKQLIVPGDLSSAAFFLVAALIVEDSNLVIANVGLNPTRTALLDFLGSMGAAIKIMQVESANGELIGNLQVKKSRIRGGIISGELTATLIDEIPVLAILGASSEEGLIVKDAAELRVKETDRIATVAENLNRMGIQVEVTPDGLAIPGKQNFHAAELDSFGDHRIAMAFAVASLAADGECSIQNSEAASVSYPEFYQTLREIAQ